LYYLESKDKQLVSVIRFRAGMATTPANVKN